MSREPANLHGKASRIGVATDVVSGDGADGTHWNASTLDTVVIGALAGKAFAAE